jgi:putative ABC transport system permease protein
MRAARWAEGLRNDLVFAFRQMRRSPGFTTVAVATLALGIGANSAIFALVDATLLRPLPFPRPDRLVMVWERTPNAARASVSPMNLLDWNERTRTFDIIGGYVPNVGGMVMSGADGMSETVPRQWVLSGFFDALGVRPVVGRTFLPADDAARADVVVLSEGFWRTRFGADPSVVGGSLRLDGDAFTVIGVVPDAAQMLGRTSMWALRSFERRPMLRAVYGFRAIGRLKPGVTIDAARRDMAGIAEGLAREYPQTNTGRGVALEPLHDALIGGELRLTSLLFLGVVGFVLLICCANVANLLLARATVRARELAIRSALGAGRSRVVRQLVTEGLVLSTIGGLAGLAVGGAILRAAPSLVPEGLLPGAVALEFDGRVAAFCGVTALVVGVLFGLAPAWQATRLASTPVIATGGRTATGAGGRLRSALVVAEVAISVLLLVGAGLLLRTLLSVENVDRGYRAQGVLTMLVDPLGSKYPTPEALTQFYEDVEREIMAAPAVRSVAWASTLPLGPSYAGRALFEIVGDPTPDDSRRPSADYQIVSPRYFETLDVPIVAGRAFVAQDTRASVPVCIVNEAFVRAYLGGRTPMGTRIAVRPAGAPQTPPTIREIVGVARQVKGRPDEQEAFIQIYVPMAQDLMDDTFLVVSPASARVQGLPAAVRAAIARVDKEQLVSVRNVMTLDDIARDATSRHRFRAVLVTMFAGLALVLAMIGVFGILAYTVQQRVRDFGVRRALGATSADVLRLVVGSAVRVVAAGGAIGLALSPLLARSLATVLFGVEPLDPASFAAVIVLVVMTAALSIAAPAWRATRVDPVTALRTE